MRWLFPLLLALPASAKVAGTAAESLTPVSCTDPVQGTWKGYERRPEGWNQYTMHVTRSGSSLSGMITAHVWNSPSRRPPPCSAQSGLREYLVSQPATGSWDGTNFTFHASSIAQMTPLCGGPSGYTPDKVWGPLLAESTIDAVSHDGINSASRVKLIRTSCDVP